MPLPDKATLLAFIQNSDGPVSRRGIVRAFALKDSERGDLQALLRELEAEGRSGLTRRRPARHNLPAVAVLEVTGVDSEGIALAIPAGRPVADADPPPAIRIEARGPAPAAGTRLLARLRRLADGSHTARPIRWLDSPATSFVGVVRQDARGYRIESLGRGRTAVYSCQGAPEAGDWQDGDLLRVRPEGGRPETGWRGDRSGTPPVEIVERVGHVDQPGVFSLLAIHQADIPHTFPDAVETAAARLPPPTPAGRTDLRTLPLVTIDGADARDFDDAVHAAPDPAGGWRLTVAIADVAWYVRPGSLLDREARRRGNSVYFPDRVVPMLPEALSGDACSLRPGVDRPCMAVQLTIGPRGGLRGFTFTRGLMRSVARLTYEQVQAARDGRPDATTAPLHATIIDPLYGAHAALGRARDRRQPLELDLPEWRVELDGNGAVAGLTRRPRLDSHRLIEDFMIAANVAAARFLAERDRPCLYRVHDRPDMEKIGDLRTLMQEHGMRAPGGGKAPDPGLFNHVLRQTAGTPQAELFSQLILRAQAQAVYSPAPGAHFGLALTRYAHFTSPIRRYADLVVHRAIIAALEAPACDRPACDQSGGHFESPAGLQGTARHVSATERRAVAAERAAFDRFAAAWLSHRVGAHLAGTISGVSRAGLFVRLDDTGADGLLPLSRLPADYYRHDRKRHSLTGTRNRLTFRPGDPIMVRLVAATGLSGQILLDHGGTATPRHQATGDRPGGNRRARNGTGSKSGRKTKSQPRRRQH